MRIATVTVLRLVGVLQLLVMAPQILAAKHYMFKACQQSGFCHRNIEYGKNQLSLPANHYELTAIDIDPQWAIITGHLTKHLPNTKDINFNFQISVLSDNNFRFTVNEDRTKAKPASALVTPERFNASQFVITEDHYHYKSVKDITIKESKNSIKITTGTLAVVIHKQLSIEMFINNKLELTINQDHFLNLEHFRSKKDNQPHLLPQELDFNMFKDDFFESKADSVPLGPESVALDFNFKGFKNIYGIPEHSDSLNLHDEIYRLFNVDIFEYEINSNLPMYGSIPFVLASRPDISMGLLWLNAADTYVHVKTSEKDQIKTHWISENGLLDFIVFYGDSPQQVNEKYGYLTGYTGLPQLFSLGYHQCRWNYNDDKDILEVTAKFDEHQIPYDTIWLDVEYTIAKQYFTWNSNFPNPHNLLTELDGTGRNLVVIIDPHIKTGYFFSKELLDHQLTINNAKNEPFVGQCWPGESIWIDSFNPNGQSLWDHYHRLDFENEFMYNNTNIHIWNDMSEISVFDGPETTGPKDLIHFGGFEDRSVHNLNGMMFHEMTYRSLTKRLSPTERQRPFILTRSYFAGLQKTAAMWTGDNMAKWEYLKISVPMVINNGIAGMPFGGVDVGGFFGNPSSELLTRWYQTGIWYPFFRAHAHIDTRRREPWIPGDPYTSIIRNAINLRYTLLPEFYTAFYYSSITGAPIMKPLFYESSMYQHNYDIEDEFFLGDSGILVKPITDEGSKEVTIIFPDDHIYYDFFNGEVSSQTYTKQVTKAIDLKDIPMVLKGGSIITRKMRYRRSSKLMVNDPYTLIIAPDTNQYANGSLYIDDFESFNYLQDQYLLVNFEYTDGKLTNKVLNKFDIPNKIEKIIILNTSCDKVNVKVAGEVYENAMEITDGNLVIKNPKLGMSDEWEINLIKGPVHDEL